MFAGSGFYIAWMELEMNSGRLVMYQKTRERERPQVFDRYNFNTKYYMKMEQSVKTEQ